METPSARSHISLAPLLIALAGACTDDVVRPSDSERPPASNPVAMRAAAMVTGPITAVVLDELGVPPGGSFARPLAINDAGMVVGDAIFAGDVFGTAFAFSGGGFTKVSQTGADHGYAIGVSANSEVVAFDHFSNGFVPFVWTPTGGARPFADQAVDFLRGSNANGVVVGGCRGSNARACLWTNPVVTDPIQLGFLTLIPAPSGVNPLSRASLATAVNLQGDAVGFSLDIDDNFGCGAIIDTCQVMHAFFWAPASGMIDLGTLPGDVSSCATGINDQQQVVGVSSTGVQGACSSYTVGGTDDRIHGFIWSPQTGMQPLGALPSGQGSVPRGINNAGIVVGYGSVPTLDPNSGSLILQSRPFVWTTIDGMRDLGTHPGGSGAGWAVAINNQNQIVGSSNYTNGLAMAVRWTLQFGSTNGAPVASFTGPGSAPIHTVVSFDGTGSSDPDNDPLTYDWDFGDQSPPGAGGTISHTYLQSGTFTVTLIVSDPSGATGTSTADITITAPSSPALSSSLDPAIVFEIHHNGLKNAYGINDAGFVVGDSWTPQLAATWTLAGGVTVIGSLPGGGQSRFDDVNASGEAVGVNNFPGSTKAILWDQATNTLGDLGIPAGAPYAHAIADNGDVLGTDFTGYARAFFKPKNGATVFLVASAPFVSVHSTDMNNAGNLIGTGLVTDFISHAITWRRYDAPLVSLAHLGGDHSRAEGINDAGDIVGWSELTPGDPARHALLWPASGGMIDLANAWSNRCAGNSEAFGINAAGIIVGQCNGLPVLWTAAQGMRSLPPPTWGSGFGTVRRVNNRLEMIGAEAYWRLANQAPTANAGPDGAGTEGSPVAFSGAGSSDPNGDALTYAWDFGDGTAGTGVGPSHTYPDNGIYNVTLTVTDQGGLANSAGNVTTIANVPPALSAGPDGAVLTTQAFALSGSFTDPGAGDAPWSYSIDWGDGTAPGSGSLTSPGAGIAGSHLYPAAGGYTVVVTVTDKDGGSGSDNAVVTVTQANRAPVANSGGPYTGKEGGNVSFSGSGSIDPDGDPLSYAWTFGDGTTGTGPTPIHTYLDNGVYTVLLTVSDGRGGTGTAVTTATINNERPVPTTVLLSTTGFQGSCRNGGSATLELSFTDKGVNDGPWAWEMIWGDRGPTNKGTFAANGQKVVLTHNYVFNRPAPFQYRLTVTDKDGWTGSSIPTQIRCVP